MKSSLNTFLKSKNRPRLKRPGLTNSVPLYKVVENMAYDKEVLDSTVYEYPFASNTFFVIDVLNDGTAISYCPHE
jgi:hypothetical protein